MGTRQPVLFIGHGNPMYALADNDFTRSLSRLGRTIAKPQTILCVSAHWLTRGTAATHMKSPETIHDFSGFPPELFAVQYPAPGSPETAERVRELLGDSPSVAMDDKAWGLDHGTWSVLRHLYPAADVPVVQLSVAVEEPPAYHLSLGRRLAPLRDQGVLIVGSGNVVHNLGRIDWSPRAKPLSSSVDFDSYVKNKTETGDAEALAEDPSAMPGGRMSVPTPDHWYPYLYSLGAADGDKVAWEYEGLENASLSMRTASFGIR